MRENILPTAVMQQFLALRYVPLRYFALVTKINKKSKAQERVIVLTELHLYSCTKEDGSIKRCLSLGDIERIYTCRNRCEVALIVMEQGEEYDLLFQAHSPAALDEFVRHMPRGVEVRDVAMSLLGRHNGSDMTIRLEKPKGYARDVADAVKWKVSSWSSLEKPSLAKKPQPKPSDSAQQAVDPAAGATATTSEPKPTTSAAASNVEQHRTAGLSTSLQSIADDRASTTSAKTDGSVKVGQLMRLESSRSAMQQHLASLSVVSDEEATELDEDGEDDGGDAEDGGNNITAGSPIGRLMRSSFRQYAKDDTDGGSFPPTDDDDGDEGTSLMQSQDVLGDDDDDDDDMNVDFGAVHVKPQQTLDGGAPLPFAVRGLGQPASPAATAGSLTVGKDNGSYTMPQQLHMEPLILRPEPSAPEATHAPRSRDVSLPAQQGDHHHRSYDSSREAELLSLLHEERTRFASQLLLTSELLAVERENGASLRRIVDALRSDVERLSLENMILKRPLSDL